MAAEEPMFRFRSNYAQCPPSIAFNHQIAPVSGTDCALQRPFDTLFLSSRQADSGHDLIALFRQC